MRKHSVWCNSVWKVARAIVLLLSIVLVYPSTFSNAWADLDLNFPWVKGYDLSRPAVRGPLPGLNQPFIDSVHGTSITRITESDSGWRRHEYSRRPAFNADSSRILMKSSSGNWLLYLVDGDQITFDTLLPGQMSELNWHPTDPNVYRIDDAVSEADETFAIRIFNPSDNLEFGTSEAQFSISDDD